ncbi:hypothetical protein [Winogradskyella pulchriflava]|uniref:YtxH domain-containing protein n=1 Tax=Winogradskyella pulchriflava TaxID=1110688 RepID=A0ABV6QBI6_9FLAO
MKKVSYLLIALFSLSLIVSSCREQKSPDEKVEEAMESVKEDLDDASDDVKDAAEDLEDEIKEAKEEQNDDN